MPDWFWGESGEPSEFGKAAAWREGGAELLANLEVLLAEGRGIAPSASVKARNLAQRSVVFLHGLHVMQPFLNRGEPPPRLWRPPTDAGQAPGPQPEPEPELTPETGEKAEPQPEPPTGAQSEPYAKRFQAPDIPVFDRARDRAGGGEQRGVLSRRTCAQAGRAEARPSRGDLDPHCSAGSVRCGRENERC